MPRKANSYTNKYNNQPSVEAEGQGCVQEAVERRRKGSLSGGTRSDDVRGELTLQCEEFCRSIAAFLPICEGQQATGPCGTDSWHHNRG